MYKYTYIVPPPTSVKHRSSIPKRRFTPVGLVPYVRLYIIAAFSRVDSRIMELPFV